MAKGIYNPKEMEEKWARKWEDDGVYKTGDDKNKKNVYVLGMFPYPSGEGLHTGHVRIFTAVDVLGRYFRMNGYNVLQPMGWDAFGLPAENAAIKRKTIPQKMVPTNEANFKRQLALMGEGYDWEKMFSTTDPDYYKWTQWLFLKLYSIKNDKGERLIYRKEVPINWCPFCKTGLANEEVLSDGTHERCGTAVEQRKLPQWVMRITDYADRLLKDLDETKWIDDKGVERKGLDWPKGILEMQRNWIGKKEGVKVSFDLKVEGQEEGKHKVEVFTTRIDTVYGVSFLVIAPEMAERWMEVGWKASEEVREYVEMSKKKTEQQRLEEAKEKTGVSSGVKAVNPFTGEEVEIYVADYVLSGVGTGAVMGVPAHDKRDGEFAKRFGLDFKQVIEGDEGYEGEGKLINSGKFSGMDSTKAREAMLKDLGERASKSETYHLRDWVFSRQRYWGEPFPLIYCSKCGDENGVVTIPEDQLPVTLPELESYEPSGTGESPLAAATQWVKTTCPICGGEAKRETDTMPNWAGSCWYFLRFADPKNSKQAWDNGELNKYLPVDWYLGGAEHAVLHLLYARFWVKAFKDLGLLDFDEPFLRLRSVGMVLAEDGKKMSKSLGNIVSPDDVVAKFGADAVRIYEMFMGPWDQAISWDTRSLIGCYRFMEKLWKLSHSRVGEKTTSELKMALEKVITKVGEDIQALKFNTAVASLMEFCNSWSKAELSKEDMKRLLLVVAPLAPFIAEELWQEVVGEKETIHKASWPEAEEVKEGKVKIVVQVGGKVRGVLEMEVGESKEKNKVINVAKGVDSVAKWLKGGEKTIFVPGKVINFVG